jgi:hypothetical protein
LARDILRQAGRNSDNTLIKQIPAWEPGTPLDKGLAITYKWANERYQWHKTGKRVGISE